MNKPDEPGEREDFRNELIELVRGAGIEVPDNFDWGEVEARARAKVRAMREARDLGNGEISDAIAVRQRALLGWIESCVREDAKLKMRVPDGDVERFMLAGTRLGFGSSSDGGPDF